MKLGVVIPENGPEQPLYVPGKGAFFVTTEGDPMVPSDIDAKIQKFNPDLRIEFQRGFGGMNGWILKKRWRQSDPRWSYVQSGQTPADKAFDLEHTFPRDCPTADMLAYVENRWGERNRPRDAKAEAERLIERARKLMEIANAEKVDEIVDMGTQKILDDTDHQRELQAEEALGVDGQTAHAMIVNDGPKRLW